MVVLGWGTRNILVPNRHRKMGSAERNPFKVSLTTVVFANNYCKKCDILEPPHRNHGKRKKIAHFFVAHELLPSEIHLFCCLAATPNWSKQSTLKIKLGSLLKYNKKLMHLKTIFIARFVLFRIPLVKNQLLRCILKTIVVTNTYSISAASLLLFASNIYSCVVLPYSMLETNGRSFFTTVLSLGYITFLLVLHSGKSSELII